MKRNGVRNTMYKLSERLVRDKEEADYGEEFMRNAPSKEELMTQKNHVFPIQYKISILVPTYETDRVFFDQMIDSVIAQTYSNWELCIADGSKSDKVKNAVMETIGRSTDPSIWGRIKYQRLPENKGISGNTNFAMSMATGDYITLLDHDDILTPDALYEVMTALSAGNYKEGNIDDNNIKIVYSDEDKINADLTRYFDHHRKPDFDIDLLRSNNYICHLFVVEASVAKKTGGFLTKYNGAQDHDFIFRCVEQVSREQIYHISKVLYHWRAHESSTADNPEAKLYAYEAGKAAIEDHLERMGLKTTVEYTAHLGFFRVKYEDSGIGYIQMTKEQFDALTPEEIEELDTELIMIRADEVIPLTDDWLKQFAGYFARPEVGAVGGKVYDRRMKIDSAGYTKNMASGEMIPNYRGMNGHYSGYMHRASIQHQVDGIPLDCMMIRKKALKFEDTISMSKDYVIVYDPFVEFRRM